MRTFSRLIALFGSAIAFASLGYAQTFVYTAFLDGPSESPPNGSPGTGFTTVTMNMTANTMRVQVQFQGLVGTTTAAHIHAPTASPLTGTASPATQVPSFVGFPLGVTSGTYDNTFDMTLASSYNAPFITANGGTPLLAFAALNTYMGQGRTYLNIHSNVFAGGEIRGFLTPVPEPATMSALGLGVIALLGRRRRKR